MKKLFYFACASLLALGTVSCDDDDEAPVRSLSATPGTLTFTATPDTPKTIDVKAENVSWKATTEAGWLTLKNAEGTADGTITVEAQSNTTTDPQNATIVIKAEGVDDVTITVTQDAGEPTITEPAIIWDRSSRSRMNLQGDVKTVSVFGNHLDDTFIYNLTFDDNGMLSSYDRMYGSTTVHFTLTYDGENRLTKIATDEFAIDLGYADHGKYVSTDNIFTTSIAINVSGDQGNIVYDGDEEGATPIAFSGEFMSEYKGEGYYATTETFIVNPENGNLLVHHIIDPFGAMDRKYNDDRINSISELTGGDIQQKAVYNENLDMTRVENIDDASKNFDIAYEYDEHQNWIKATYSGGSYDGEVLDRTVTY